MRVEQSVNIADTEIINFKIVEKLPPNSPYARSLNMEGVQTTPQLARGYLPGSAIAIMNGNLSHVCDFKFIFNVDVNLFAGINPVTAIQKAIRGAQLKATNRLRLLLQDAGRLFREAIDKIIAALGFDPSGQLSFYFSTGKDILRKIQEVIEYIAEKVEAVLEWVFFAQQIAQLIQWIQSLPEKIKNLLLACLKQFTSSLQQIADNIKTLPQQVATLTQTQIQGIANSFATAEQAVKSSLESNYTKNQSNLPAGAVVAITDGNANTIINYINSSSPNSNTIMANSTATLMSNSSPP